MRHSKRVLAATIGMLLGGAIAPSEAALNAVDPGPYTEATGFFPLWYQDTSGLALELCLSPAVIAAGAVPGGLGGAACTLLPNPGIFDPAFPFVFPAAAGDCPQDPANPTVCNFPDESFYFMGDAAFTSADGTVDVTYVSNLEAAFANGDPAPNEQITFARIRIRIDLPPDAPAGTYTVTHPYGIERFDVTAGGTKAINMTRDIGIGAAGVFTGALAGDIGPFLVDETVPTLGFIPAVNPSTGLTESYIGDPNTPRPVLGSPFGTNFVRVQAPDGAVLAESNEFTVMGKVFSAQLLPTPVQIERSTYSRAADPLSGATVAQQDVFVNAPSTGSVSFQDANGATVTMTDADADSEWYGQSTNDPVLPATITVTADNPPGNTPSTASSDMVDLIIISRAEYSAGTLTVEAVSSDEVDIPVLTVNGQTMTLVGTGPLQTATFTGLTIPPARVTVASASGGSDTEEVVLLP